MTGRWCTEHGRFCLSHTPAGCKIHRVWSVAAWSWVPADDCNCPAAARVRQVGA